MFHQFAVLVGFGFFAPVKAFSWAAARADVIPKARQERQKQPEKTPNRTNRKRDYHHGDSNN